MCLHKNFTTITKIMYTFSLYTCHKVHLITINHIYEMEPDISIP